MKIHKEGYIIILVSFLLIGGLDVLFWYFLWPWPIIFYILLAASLIFFGLIVSFFRVPTRHLKASGKEIICPADGKVVVIEEVEEAEYFQGKRRQISIFMSPLNVHCQWYPITGEITYSKYHPGKYLVAWDPKSSTENERTTIVVKSQDGQEILFRQIAGAVARRIVNYAKEGDAATQGSNCGFIKFGSRVDVLLPLDAAVNVKIGDKVAGIETILATMA